MSFTERAIFPLSVIKELRRRLPRNFPIGVRLILKEWVPGGVDLPEALAWAKLLDKESIAHLSVSAGTYNSIFSPTTVKTMTKPSYLRDDVIALRKMVKTPTIISGRIITPELAGELISKQTADLIGLGRPLRTDIQWLSKAKNQRRRLKECINCNWCLKRVVLEQGSNCRWWPRSVQEKIDLEHKPLTRNYKRLWVVTDTNDFETIKTLFPQFLPANQNVSGTISPTILFFQHRKVDDGLNQIRENIVSWGEAVLKQSGFADGKIKTVVRLVEDVHDKEIMDEIEKGNHGIILVCRNANQPWRERLIYRVRGKTTALISTNERSSEVVAPVDLSHATVLVLMFFRQTYLGKEGMNIRFVHILDGPAESPERRWREISNIVGLDKPPPLQLIQSKGNIAVELSKLIHTGKYGTVVMGKRGFSRIKRWLLGSVSAGVLRRLTDQTLCLID